MKFPYTKYDGFFRPIIPVTFISNNNFFPYRALIDTGADLSVIHAEIAEILDIDLKTGRRHQFGGITGKGIGYIHTLNLEIGGNIFYKIPVSFSEDIAPQGHGILGHEGLFDKIKLIFELGKKQIEIIPKEYKK